MKQSDKLFALIQSMSKQEKRYFRMHAESVQARSGTKDYLLLYEVISRQKQYDEDAVRHALKNHKNLLKRFAVLKHYLYEQILESLCSYNSELTVDIALTGMMRKGEALLERALYDQSQKILSRAKAMAYKYERLPLLVMLLRLEMRMQAGKGMRAYAEEERRILKQLKNQNNYRRLADSIIKIETTVHYLKDKGSVRRLQRIMKNTLLEREDRALSFDARIWFCYIQDLYSRYLHDTPRSLRFAGRFVELMEENPAQIRMRPLNYLSSLNNLSIIQMRLWLIDEYLLTQKKVKEISTLPGVKLTRETEMWRFAFGSAIEFTYNLNSGTTGQPAFIRKVEQGLVKYGNMIPHAFRMVIIFDMGHHYFMEKQYRKAMVWLGKITNENFGTTREDTQVFSKILMLLCYYEEGHGLMDHIVRSTYRFLYKKKRTYRFETVFMEYIKKISRAGNASMINKLFAAFRAELLELEKDPVEREASTHFDFISWLDSKLQRRAFAEVVREKFEAKRLEAKKPLTR